MGFSKVKRRNDNNNIFSETNKKIYLYARTFSCGENGS